MCFSLYSIVGQIHYLPIYYFIEHSFTCQELFRKRKDGVGFHRHHEIVIIKKLSYLSHNLLQYRKQMIIHQIRNHRGIASMR